MGRGLCRGRLVRGGGGLGGGRGLILGRCRGRGRRRGGGALVRGALGVGRCHLGGGTGGGGIGEGPATGLTPREIAGLVTAEGVQMISRPGWAKGCWAFGLRHVRCGAARRHRKRGYSVVPLRVEVFGCTAATGLFRSLATRDGAENGTMGAWPAMVTGSKSTQGPGSGIRLGGGLYDTIPRNSKQGK